MVVMSGSAFAAMLDSPPVRALFGPHAVVQAMLDVEAALCAAQAEVGLVQAEHAAVVAACCRAEDYPVEDLLAASRTAGSLAIPLVQALNRRVRDLQPQAAAAVHLGATSQDIIDTAWCLQGRKALALLDADLDRLLQSLIALKDRHGHAPLLARTLMQPASVITFSARLLNWFAPVLRARASLRELAERALRLQLGGAVGTAVAWGEQAQAIACGMARRLSLPLEVTPWQAQRDEFARLCAELGVLAGALGKVATDVALMSQTEVGELLESGGPGRGVSSAMAHKRNPVGSLIVRAALHRAGPRVASILGAMAVEQERALGAWQAEGAEAAELLVIVCGAAQALAEAMEHAEVNEGRMRRHIEDLPGGTRTLDPAQAAAAGAANTEAAWRPLLDRHGAMR